MNRLHKLECKECSCEIKPQAWGNKDYRCACPECGKVVNFSETEIEIKEDEGEKTWLV
jgi:ribosomal protein L33